MTRFNVFEEKIALFRRSGVILKRRAQLIGWIRVALFLIFVACSIYALSMSRLEWFLLVFVLFVPIFGWLVKLHNKVRFDRDQNMFLIKINEDEVCRQHGNLKQLDLRDYEIDPTHPYALDMDVFGQHSIFRLLTRSKLVGAQNMMSDWLLNHARPDVIRRRQNAVKELQNQIDWRQTLTAYSCHDVFGSCGDLGAIIDWLRIKLTNIDHWIFHLIKFIVPISTIMIFMGWWLAGWNGSLFLVPLVLNLSVLTRVNAVLSDFNKEFGQVHLQIKKYVWSIQHIRKAEFDSEVLQSHFVTLADAEKAINQLGQILHFIQGRANVLYMPVNLWMALDIHGFHAIMSWKTKHLDRMTQWLEAVHEVSVLSDIASYAFANPNYAVPNISKTDEIAAKDLGHPLISEPKRIYNDFVQDIDRPLGLITGSNMSGKSTFLRTVGVNLILAQVGAPVCATSFTCPPILVFSSMRTQDNLEESVSSFYAELIRLKQALDLIANGQKIYYLLDEILKGTNSEDRHKGAISLIWQLAASSSMGLVSTHDIQLSELSQSDERIVNYSFNSTIDGGSIVFDYRLTPGVCRSFNASLLMKKMGIIKE